MSHNLRITQQRYDEYYVIACDGCDYRRLVLLGKSGFIAKFGHARCHGDVAQRHDFNVGVEGLELEMVGDVANSR